MRRLDRFLAEETSFSRSEIKKLIRAGRVSVNGSTDIRPETKTEPETDCVLLDGRRILPAGRICIMMNKPAGVVSATEDRRTRTVLDLVDEPFAAKLFPVGRLDKDTEGLLLLTNDGMLSHNLLSPGRHVSKTYFAVITGMPDEEIIQRFLEGIDIGEKKRTLPAQLRFLSVDGDFLVEYVKQGAGENTAGTMPPGIVSPDEMQEFCMKSIALADYARCGENECCSAVSVSEGKFHQIKRMFQACGRDVRFLKRIAMGKLLLDPALAPGSYRTLTDEEIKALERSVSG